MTAFATLTAAVRTALLQAPALGDGNVWRGRLRPIPAEHSHAIVIRLSTAPGQRSGIALGPTDWNTVIEVDCYARCTPAQDPEAAVDTLLGDVYARLAANASISGGVMDIMAEPQIDWTFAEADNTLACATLQLRVNHRTEGLTLNPWS
jgi:hypothetical protein